MFAQTHWLIPHRMPRTMLDSAPAVVNRLGRMDFSARTETSPLCDRSGGMSFNTFGKRLGVQYFDHPWQRGWETAGRDVNHVADFY